MSTKIEDISDSEEEEYYQEDRQEYDDLKEDTYVEKFTEEKPPEVVDINTRIFNMIVEKLKHPALVTFIMVVLTHPLLIQGIFKIPYVEVADQTIGVNVILSILAGILFFIFREFI
jgi:hypothetical protein